MRKHCPLSFLKLRETLEFGMGLERVWRMSKLTLKSHGNVWTFQLLTTQKQNICCSCVGVPNSTEFGESPSHSKHTPVPKTIKKNALHAYGFGASLERVWRISELTPFFSPPKNTKRKNENKLLKTYEFGPSLERTLERVWRISKLTPSSQGSVCLMSIFIFSDFFLQKKTKTKWVWREFGESLEILQTHFVVVFFLKKI